jgi:hypothetical protein
MKRLVATCPITKIAVIVAVCETVILPADGTIISIPCPACRETHDMPARDRRPLREAS